MASTFGPNTNVELQGTGDNPGTWGTVLNNAALLVLDTVLGGVQSFSLSNVNVTVTTTQSQNNAFKFTGLLTGNVDITFPAIGRTIFVANNTTGSFTVTLKRSGGGTSAVVPQGRNGFYILDSTGVIAETGNTPAGAVLAFAMQTPPSGWLECDGTAVSRSTYAALFAAIGTVYGGGDGSTTFNLPDLRAYFIRGWDHGRGIDTGRAFGSTQTGQNLAHTHAPGSLVMPNHGHPTFVSGGDNNTSQTSGGIMLRNSSTAVKAAFTGTPSSVNGQQVGGSGTAAITGTSASDGGTEARPINIAMLYCIRT
jgi:microcystin-dependent protein